MDTFLQYEKNQSIGEKFTMTQMEIKNRIENFEEDSRLKIRNQTFTNEKKK